MSEPYTVRWSSAAKRAITTTLPENVAAAALELILGPLRENPLCLGKPLRAPLEGTWSARKATYRVLYRIEEQTRTITIESIKHRNSAYR